MKRRRAPLTIPACVAALVLAAGCAGAPERHPNSTQVVALSPGHPSPGVEIPVVSAVRVVLPGPEAGSGYVWEIISNNRRVLEQMGPLRPVPATDARAPATTVSFYALEPGRSTIGFVLVHPGEAEAVPAARCSLAVVVDD